MARSDKPDLDLRPAQFFGRDSTGAVHNARHVWYSGPREWRSEALCGPFDYETRSAWLEPTNEASTCPACALEPGSELHDMIPVASQGVMIQREDGTRFVDMSSMDPDVRAQTLKAAKDVARANEKREQERAHLSPEGRDLADMKDEAEYRDALRAAIVAAEGERQRVAAERAKAQAARRRQKYKGR